MLDPNERTVPSAALAPMLAPAAAVLPATVEKIRETVPASGGSPPICPGRSMPPPDDAAPVASLPVTVLFTSARSPGSLLVNHGAWVKAPPWAVEPLTEFPETVESRMAPLPKTPPPPQDSPAVPVAAFPLNVDESIATLPPHAPPPTAPVAPEARLSDTVARVSVSAPARRPAHSATPLVVVTVTVLPLALESASTMLPSADQAPPPSAESSVPSGATTFRSSVESVAVSVVLNTPPPQPAACEPVDDGRSSFASTCDDSRTTSSATTPPPMANVKPAAWVRSTLPLTEERTRWTVPARSRMIEELWFATRATPPPLAALLFGVASVVAAVLPSTVESVMVTSWPAPLSTPAP